MTVATETASRCVGRKGVQGKRECVRMKRDVGSLVCTSRGSIGRLWLSGEKKTQKYAQSWSLEFQNQVAPGLPDLWISLRVRKVPILLEPP